MLGTIVNALAIILGGGIGLLTRKGFPTAYRMTVTQGLGLAVVLIGLRGAFKSDDLLVVIISLVIGGILGEAARIETGLEKFGKWVENRLGAAGNGMAKGFVTASLIYCVGAMAIVGSLESGLTGNHQTLYAKSLLDGISAVIFASTFGVGVLFSAVSVFVYQGALTLSASFLQPFLVPAVIDQMSAVGGLLIFGIGINLLEIQKIRVANMLPAVFLPLVYFIVCP